MDHRCLYGHRIPEQFSFAINQRVCPTCGAPCVTLDGYRLARRLTQEVPLEALAAFTVVRLLETHYSITAKPADGVDDASASQQIEVAPSAAEDPASAEPPPKGAARAPSASAAPPAASSSGAQNPAGFRSRLAGLSATTSLVPEAAAVDAPPPRRRAGGGTPGETAEAERDFFAAPER